MGLALSAIGAFVALVAVLCAVGRWYPGTGAEQLDRKPTRSHEDEIGLGLDGVEQMLELQNECRRRGSG